MWLGIMGGTVEVPNCQCNSGESNDSPGNRGLDTRLHGSSPRCTLWSGVCARKPKQGQMSKDNNGGQESEKGRKNGKTPRGNCGDTIALSIIPRSSLAGRQYLAVRNAHSRHRNSETPPFSAIALLSGSKFRRPGDSR